MLTRMKARGVSNVAAKAVLQRGSLDGAIGSALTLGDDDGRRIYAGEGTQLAWLNDRLSSVSNIAELHQALADRPSMAPEFGRSAENRLVGVWLLAIIAYIDTLAVANSAGVTIWEVREKRILAKIAQKDVTTIAFGSYPGWMHELRGALLVLSAAGVMTALETDGVVQRRFNMHLPQWEHPVGVYTNPREVLVSTDRGGLYQLWIH